jgi:indole-3-glycerol phosphate synthase
MKKASPSAGLLQAAYRPVEIARRYRDAGAAAISVLTEPRHFKGSGSDLREVRRVVELPILRKDFMCDPYQVYEAAAWGADVILLIVAALERSVLEGLYREALACGLDVLVEAHTEAELDVGLGLEQAVIGVNSRDLKTLRTDLAVARGLAARIPAGRLAVAESGIRSYADVEMLAEAGYRGFLVGEALMRGGAPEAKLAQLLGR